MSKILFIIKVFLSISSGILLVLAFPPFNLSGLAFIGLVPLLVVLKLEEKLLKNFIFSFITGIIFLGGLLYWIAGIKLYQVPPWMLIIGWMLIATTFGCYFGVFGLIIKFLDVKMGIVKKIIIVPIFWVALEFIRSIFPLGGFPWGILGYSQYQNLMLIQIADITGVFGISFLILLVNSCITVTLFQIFQKPAKWSLTQSPMKRQSFPCYFRIPFALHLCLLTLVGCYIYGFMVMREKLPLPDLKIAIIQSNIDTKESWDWAITQEQILQGLIHLTQTTKSQQPSLTIWTETAVRDSPLLFDSLRDKLSSLAKDMRTNLLIGAPHIEFKNTKTQYYNSAFLFSDAGEIIGRYDKIHLVPIAERLPLEDIFPIVRNLFPQAGYYLPGKELTVFQSPVRFNVLICFEGIFGDLTRRFVQTGSHGSGAQFIVNISNDAWFKTTASYYQHFSMDIFRAIENKTYFLRAGNTGISAVITPYGNIKEILDIGKEGVIISKISPMNKNTFYTRYGDVFACLCLIISVWLWILGIAKNTISRMPLR
ncbi:MAG: apolipoprotein N-acyltransferase [Nitrospirota bacterium]